MKRQLSYLFRVAVTLAMVAAGVVVGLALWDYYLKAPWTRDGRVRADVVAIAPDVSGLVTEVLVKDDQHVRRGDVLFRIDPERFDLALRHAEAVVADKNASVEEAKLDDDRYAQLTDVSVSRQKVEAVHATYEEAKAAYDQAVADRDLAKLNLARSEVRASVNGQITNMELQPGAYVSAGHGVMALIDDDTLRVEGYFEETKLPRIRVDDRATVILAGEKTPLTGHVQSVAGGIDDRERSAGADLLANINPTFSWVRLAQRIPVRIALDPVPPGVALVAGRTATVEIASDADTPRSPYDWLWRLMSRKRQAEFEARNP
ncbi:MAG: HlyD family secretion protein [Hyphomicrobiales bacterium]|nr:HlyD family secretion protein [Hyphomicrobiales bacterium]MBV8664443.1 HlyD family secretion protein [Hyphomicrobiales bacterium]